MVSILCYGDSNTWGYDPMRGLRFSQDIRWTGVLQRMLGDDYHVIEEGLCGRTVANATAGEPEADGLAYLPACLKSHAPLDWVVLMLGTNDLQIKYNMVPLEIARCMERMVQMIINPYSHGFGPAPKLLLVAPPPVGPGIRSFVLRDLFGAEACIEPSTQFARRFHDIALTYNCRFLDAGQVVSSCMKDGVHLDIDSHFQLAKAIHEAIVRN